MVLEVKINIEEDYTIVLKEVFNNISLEPSEGSRFAICMRDDTVEFTVVGSGKFFRANMNTGDMELI